MHFLNSVKKLLIVAPPRPPLYSYLSLILIQCCAHLQQFISPLHALTSFAGSSGSYWFLLLSFKTCEQRSGGQRRGRSGLPFYLFNNKKKLFTITLNCLVKLFLLASRELEGENPVWMFAWQRETILAEI